MTLLIGLCRHRYAKHTAGWFPASTLSPSVFSMVRFCSCRRVMLRRTTGRTHRKSFAACLLLAVIEHIPGRVLPGIYFPPGFTARRQSATSFTINRHPNFSHRSVFHRLYRVRLPARRGIHGLMVARHNSNVLAFVRAFSICRIDRGLNRKDYCVTHGVPAGPTTSQAVRAG